MTTPPAHGGRRLLVVEDDPTMRRVLSDNFTFSGYQVHAVDDGRVGLQAVGQFAPDIIVLDVMLPGLSGFEFCRRLREQGSCTPIVLLTAKSHEADVILGLNSGADDYVVKPFSLDVLLARVHACLRRQQPVGEIVEFDACRLDRTARRLFRDGAEVLLTPKEFRLLDYFVRHAGRALTRQTILDGVWGDEFIVTERSVDRCVTTLRNKVELEPEQPRRIKTIRDVGYRFDLK